ncbi:RecQ family zinc-binding domain-containing protein, partial [Neobacillus vireti]|uniref:RecQ family zinc-binding domain-containing protein n=1 Tax=Neobacillus vireti TaxID=220686 RepID=UPI002FFDA01B
IIHYHMPMQIESYLQEIGRAGRDGLPSVAILLYAPGDEQLPIQLVEGELPSEQQIDWLFTNLINQHMVNDGVIELNQELSTLGGFSEIQWRIIKEYVNHPNHQITNLEKLKTSMKEFVRDRFQLKHDNIFNMKKLVESQTCRREFILHYFEEDGFQKVPCCCDICGVNLNHYQSSVNTPSLQTREENWKDYLAKILIKL